MFKWIKIPALLLLKLFGIWIRATVTLTQIFCNHLSTAVTCILFISRLSSIITTHKWCSELTWRPSLLLISTYRLSRLNSGFISRTTYSNESRSIIPSLPRLWSFFQISSWDLCNNILQELNIVWSDSTDDIFIWWNSSIYLCTTFSFFVTSRAATNFNRLFT